MSLLFSYGTLQDPAVQLELFGRRLVGTSDELVGFRHTAFLVTDPQFAARSGSETHSMARFTGRDDDRIRGTALQLTDAELSIADAYEPVAYERVRTRLASGADA